jgi:hypothetical protein
VTTETGHFAIGVHVLLSFALGEDEQEKLSTVDAEADLSSGEVGCCSSSAAAAEAADPAPAPAEFKFKFERAFAVVCAVGEARA